MQAWLADLWYDTILWASSAAMTLGFSLRTEGWRHVPATGPALLVANHQSFLDPVLVGLAARRHLCFLARKTLFRHRLFAPLIRSLSAVPIDQEGFAREGLRVILDQLNAGRAVITFPEGHRTPDGTIHPLRPGVHLLIRKGNAPVIPVGIAGAYDAWPRSQPLPVPAPLFLPPGPGTIAVSIGRPLSSRWFEGKTREQVLDDLLAEIQAAHTRAERLRRKTRTRVRS